MAGMAGQLITRFAPSPTGPLHLGHAFSALTAFDMAKKAGGRFLLRIEDTDIQRSKPAWEQKIYDDLQWLGITWETPVRRQSEHLAVYDAAILKLANMGLVYPCGCSRADIGAAANAPQEGAPLIGPDGVVYPGTCQGRVMAGLNDQESFRLHMSKAIKTVDKNTLFYFEKERKIQVHPDWLCDQVGDVVLRRKGTGAAAYHMAAVLDDAAQGVTHVIRGEDLAEATGIHVLLQRLLGLPVPQYHHHRLIRDENGKRLAKRDDARAIAKYREDGASPGDIRRMLGL